MKHDLLGLLCCPNGPGSCSGNNIYNNNIGGSGGSRKRQQQQEQQLRTTAAGTEANATSQKQGIALRTICAQRLPHHATHTLPQ